ncbi:hypothetical protein AB6A40_009675 [Gnathostoma spinigerum]|uniref:Uncharacterized protein n=1 Tax=Gnathostoma spinigerum TaxID=75299 RepID=A0ABD6EUF3_9BILA
MRCLLFFLVAFFALSSAYLTNEKRMLLGVSRSEDSSAYHVWESAPFFSHSEDAPKKRGTSATGCNVADGCGNFDDDDGFNSGNNDDDEIQKELQYPWKNYPVIKVSNGKSRPKHVRVRVSPNQMINTEIKPSETSGVEMEIRKTVSEDKRKADPKLNVVGASQECRRSEEQEQQLLNWRCKPSNYGGVLLQLNTCYISDQQAQKFMKEICAEFASSVQPGSHYDHLLSAARNVSGWITIGCALPSNVTDLCHRTNEILHIFNTEFVIKRAIPICECATDVSSAHPVQTEDDAAYEDYSFISLDVEVFEDFQEKASKG